MGRGWRTPEHESHPPAAGRVVPASRGPGNAGSTRGAPTQYYSPLHLRHFAFGEGLAGGNMQMLEEMA
eukprot:7489502-Pyramimonas_sp.AAC.1